MSYDHKRIEKRWREQIEEKKPYACDTSDFSKPKF